LLRNVNFALFSVSKVRTISFNKTLPSFVSLIWTHSSTHVRGIGAFHVRLQLHQPACPQLVVCLCEIPRLLHLQCAARSQVGCEHLIGGLVHSLAFEQAVHTCWRPSPAEMLTRRASPRLCVPGQFCCSGGYTGKEHTLDSAFGFKSCAADMMGNSYKRPRARPQDAKVQVAGTGAGVGVVAGPISRWPARRVLELLEPFL
jgi:hypothetical protein